MPGTTQSAQPRVIVIPRQLEGFFYERLTAQFAERDDVRVVVDRRVGERRRPRWVSGAGPFTRAPRPPRPPRREPGVVAAGHAVLGVLSARTVREGRRTPAPSRTVRSALRSSRSPGSR